MKDDDVKCRQAGMDDYLTKPLVRQLLAECLHRFLPVHEPAVIPLAEETPGI